MSIIIWPSKSSKVVTNFFLELGSSFSLEEFGTSITQGGLFYGASLFPVNVLLVDVDGLQ
jgi:hypothetical protein